jgi:2-succinyl-5-enolpyruvyl-6-hydroxy-3-cyclohexene-1-carboxylate synthase
VAVVTTSGTAAVNLHPAVVEADYSGVPLVALTADRPVELRGVGANQTIDQVRLYGASVRHFSELSVDTDPSADDQRAAVASALVAARAGPVHLDVAFREPLVPDDPEPPAWSRDATRAAPAWRPDPPSSGTLLEPGPRTVVVAGDGAGWEARWVAEAASWPLLAEPSSGARSGPNALAAYRLLLGRLGPEVERVVVLGRPTLSRPIARLLSRADVEVVVVPRSGRVVDLGPRRPLVAEAVAPRWVDQAATRAQPDDWLLQWLHADSCARQAMHGVLEGSVTGPAVAQTVAASVPPGGLLVAGSSSAVRDLDLADPWDEPPLVLANRGASGIDGTISTAVGAALAHGGPAVALMGDLTFLHDSTGLVIGPGEPRPDLTVVVVNDDGGGLFTLLEQGAPEHADAFERVFGTPHGADLAALCAATSTAYVRAGSLERLRAELEVSQGLRVVELRTDRHATRDLHERLRSAVDAALA